jgi:hypothetical protein
LVHTKQPAACLKQQQSSKRKWWTSIGLHVIKTTVVLVVVCLMWSMNRTIYVLKHELQLSQSANNELRKSIESANVELQDKLKVYKKKLKKAKEKIQLALIRKERCAKKMKDMSSAWEQKSWLNRKFVSFFDPVMSEQLTDIMSELDIDLDEGGALGSIFRADTDCAFKRVEEFSKQADAELKLFVKSHNWKKAKKLGHKWLLKYHPDKLPAVFPDCPWHEKEWMEASSKLAQRFTDQYTYKKKRYGKVTER